jgi:hypothetical protein
MAGKDRSGRNQSGVARELGAVLHDSIGTSMRSQVGKGEITRQSRNAVN